MVLVLFRHAQKGITPFEDPELSEQGLRQAQIVSALVRNKILPNPTKFLCSKKIRTLQTLAPVADDLALPVQKESLFDIRDDSETLVQFRERIQQGIQMITENISSDSDVCYVCTHYDWIEESMSIFDCTTNLSGQDFAHWAPAQYLILEKKSTATKWTFIKKGVAK